MMMIFVQAVTHSRQKKLNVAYVFFHTPVAAMCFSVAEVRTSANLTGFRTYARIRTDILFSYRR